MLQSYPKEANELHIKLVLMATVARSDLVLQSYPEEATELHIDLIEVIQGCRRILPPKVSDLIASPGDRKTDRNVHVPPTTPKSRAWVEAKRSKRV